MPAKKNFSVVRGDTMTIVVVMTTDGVTPIDITGRVYSMQLRTSPAATVVSATFVCTVSDGTTGEVTCVLSAENSAKLTPTSYSYDLQEVASGIVSTVLIGSVKVIADTTR